MLVKVPVSCNGSWGKDVLFSFSIPVFYQWGVFICGSTSFGGLFFFFFSAGKRNFTPDRKHAQTNETCLSE